MVTKEIAIHLLGRSIAPLLLAALPVVAAAQQPAAVPGIALPSQAELVGPGVVSGPFHDFAPSLIPDGKTLLFTRTDSGFSRMVLMQSQLVDGKWQAPTVLPFSGRWNDGDGVISPDGSRFVYISNRPPAGAAAKGDLDLWLVLRKPDGTWGEPQRLPDYINTTVNEIYPSFAADGTLYFGRPGGSLFRSALRDGAYQQPEALPFKGASFAIAPDQSFGIVGVADSNFNSDLFHVARTAQGWGQPVRLDGPVNSPQLDLTGSISADGKMLLFASTRRGAPQAWPRQRTLQTAAEVANELLAIDQNGLRNIYRVDISSLRK